LTDIGSRGVQSHNQYPLEKFSRIVMKTKNPRVV